jgi:hypothetical protein
MLNSRCYQVWFFITSLGPDLLFYEKLIVLLVM